MWSCSRILEDCGFRCPGRKGIAEFLQEVKCMIRSSQFLSFNAFSFSSASSPFEPAGYMQKRRSTVLAPNWSTYLIVMFQQTSLIENSRHLRPLGKRLEEELSEPYAKSKNHNNALSSNMYSLPKWKLFKACMSRELLLFRRNSSVYLFRTSQVMIFTCTFSSSNSFLYQHLFLPCSLQS